MSWKGHLRTIAPRLHHAVRPAPPPPSSAWRLPVEDPVAGRVVLGGRFLGLEDAWGYAPGTPRRAVLIVHGLGGSSDSRYARRAAARAMEEGWASLRLDLRGSDRRGEDYYHAGLSADLHAALASPELAAFDELYAIGYSIGGHLVLRMAVESCDPRLAAVAAICPPLALWAGADHLDRRSNAVYRAYLLAGLRSIYRAVAARREVPLPLDRARRIRYIREWDDRVVAPRHGFDGAGDYYRRVSVGPHLSDLRVPALVVACEDDPMIPAAAVRPWLEDAGDAVSVRWLATGGHLGADVGADLGFGHAPSLGLERQLFRWLAAHGGSARERA